MADISKIMGIRLDVTSSGAPTPPAPGERDIKDIDVYNEEYGADTTFKLYGLEFSSNGTSWTDHTYSPDWAVVEHDGQDPPSWNSGDESWDFFMGNNDSVTLDANGSWMIDYRPILARFSWGVDNEESSSVNRVDIRSSGWPNLIGRFGANEDHIIETPICVALNFYDRDKALNTNYVDQYGDTAVWSSYGVRWRSTGNTMTFTPVGTWVNFYAPSQVRLMANSATITNVEIRDAGWNLIGSYSGAASQVVNINLTWNYTDDPPDGNSTSVIYDIQVTGSGALIDFSFDPTNTYSSIGDSWVMYYTGTPESANALVPQHAFVDGFWIEDMPTKLRITLADNAAEYVALYDSDDVLIAGDVITPVSIGTHTMDITYDAAPIGRLVVSPNSGSPVRITNIEAFLYDEEWFTFYTPKYWYPVTINKTSWEITP